MDANRTEHLRGSAGMSRMRTTIKLVLVAVLLLLTGLDGAGLNVMAQSGGGQQVSPQVDVTALVDEGDLLTLQSRFEEAEAKYSEAIRSAPNNPLPYVRWSRLLVFDMRPIDAAARAQLAVQIDQTNAEAYARLARAHDWEKKYTEALMAAQQAITFDPNYAEGYAFLAEIYLDMGQVALADAQATRALQLDPNSSEAHRSKAFILVAQDNLDGAIKEAEKAAQLQPTLWLRFDDLATVLRLIGDYSQAIAFYQRAIDLRPKAASYTGMALSHIAQSQLPQALTALQSAVTLDPGYAQAQGAVGLVYAEMGQCAQALPYIQKALQLDPTLAIAKQAQDLCAGGAGVPPAQPTGGIPVLIAPQETPQGSGGGTPMIVVVTTTPQLPVEPPVQIVTTMPVLPTTSMPPAQPALSGKIAYPVFDTGRKVYDIYLANADGSNRQRIIAEASCPDLSPDGSQIAYRSWDDQGRGIFARKLDGSEQRVLTEHTFLEDLAPKWSPNADLIAFASLRESDRRPRVYLANPGGKSDWVIQRGAEAAFGETPAWLPDGRLIYNACLGNSCGLVLMNRDGGGAQLITTQPPDKAPDAAPDGSKIAFMSQRDGNWEIYTTDVSGGNIQRLTSDPANDGLPVWSPDGRSIAFASDRGGVWAIWIMNADGANQRQLFVLEGPLDGHVRQEQDFASRGWTDENISWIP